MRRHFLWLFALALSCDQEVRTEHRQVRLATELQSYDAYAPSIAVVEASTVCLDYTGYRASAAETAVFTDADSEDLAACYDEHVTGPATLSADGCIRLDGPGSVVWSASRQACAIEGDFGDDEVRIESITLRDTLGAFGYAVPNMFEFEEIELQIAGFYATPPDGVVAEVGEPIYVIEDGLRSISTALVHRDNLRRVAVHEAWATGTAIAGTPSFPEDGESRLALEVDAKAGDIFSVTLHLPTGELDAGQVHVVSRQEVASLSLQPALLRIAETDMFLALGAQAIARDAEGRVLREPPVTWTVLDGDAELERFDSDDDGAPDPADYANIRDACEGAEAGESRSAVLEGRLDDFTKAVRVQWNCVGATPDEGCGCRTNPGRPGLAWIFGMVALGATRRRRLQRG